MYEKYQCCLPVSVTVHNSCSPFLSVIDQPDGSFQGLSGFVNNAVSHLENTGDKKPMNQHSEEQVVFIMNLKASLSRRSQLPATSDKLTSTLGIRPE